MPPSPIGRPKRYSPISLGGDQVTDLILYQLKFPGETAIGPRMQESTGDLEVQNLRAVEGYRILRALHGRDTLLAFDPVLARSVVVRFIAGSGERGLEWARSLGGVEHAAVAKIFRVAQLRDEPYLITELLPGRRLDPKIDGSDVDRIIALIAELAEAVALIHRRGVFHGEIAPDTIFIGEDGEPRLAAPAPALPDHPAPFDKEQARDVAALLDVLRQLAAGKQLGSPFDAWLAGAEDPPSAAQLARELENASGRAMSKKKQAEPYRGLLSFSVEHQSIFFGRRAEIAETLSRLEVQPALILSGKSGSGKSSLAKAGIAASIAAGRLGERPWTVVSMVPGTKPLSVLAGLLAKTFPEAPEIEEVTAFSPQRLAPAIAEQTATSVLLVVDQLEELFTLSRDDQREGFFRLLESFFSIDPRHRLLATIRSDFLADLIARPGAGPLFSRAIFHVDRMGPSGMREAIVAPARSAGFRFESEEMIEELIHAGAGGLPLLSFVLSELWARRDVNHRSIPHRALEEIGGAAGALAVHANRVLATMSAAERQRARRLLLALISPSRTRIRRTTEDLVIEPDDREALEALVRGRLVVAGAEAGEQAQYELSHEALIEAWPRLREWIEEESDVFISARRLRSAAEEWLRLDRAVELLWSERQLSDLTPQAIALAASDKNETALAFVEASRERQRQQKKRRSMISALAPVIALGLIAGAWATLDRRQEVSIRKTEAEAQAALLRSAAAERKREEAAARAMLLFDRGEVEHAEETWTESRAHEQTAAHDREAALIALRKVLSIRPDRPSARQLAAEATLGSYLAAERAENLDLARALRLRLEAYSAEKLAILDRPGKIELHVAKGVEVTLARVIEAEDGRLDLEAVPAAFDRLPAGSYVIGARREGYAPASLPVLVERNAIRKLELHLIPENKLPAGFIHVPGGPTLYGSVLPDGARRLLDAHPRHEIVVPSFLIAAHETTRAEYREYASAMQLPCSGCDRAPDLPMAGLTWHEASAYASWLDRSGRVPGARLCTEKEWERAARGADGRPYPHGRTIAPSDACLSEPSAPRDGPCPAGQHPRSRSVFGADDLIGNVWEWTQDSPSANNPEEAVLRGGSWSEDVTSPWLYTSNRGIRPKVAPSSAYGVRICANVPAL